MSEQEFIFQSYMKLLTILMKPGQDFDAAIYQVGDFFYFCNSIIEFHQDQRKVLLLQFDDACGKQYRCRALVSSASKSFQKPFNVIHNI